MTIKLPVNAKTGKEYTGYNINELMETSYQDQTWATFLQWKELGFSVCKGEKGTKLVKIVSVEDAKDPSKKKNVPRGFTVFNIAQVQKIEAAAAK